MPNAAEDRAGEKSPSRKQSLFNGQVMIHTLERTDNPRARSEVQARLLSPNGELAVLSAENAVIRHLGYLELKQGIARGHHYHKHRHESFYMISGAVNMLLEVLESGEKISVQIFPGDLVIINPGIAHAFLPTQEGKALEFASEPFDAADIYRHLIQL
jgi:oxalate decarboxylase/phosphoglucose isomerase-like protein (cupin superfamily)